jgi:hypothetical protein
VSRIEVCPGFGGGVARFGRHETTEFELAGGADCAAVFLPAPVDARLTPFRAASFDGTSLPTVVSVLGYTVGDSGQDQFMGSGALLLATSTEIRYGVATTDGISGGPIFGDAVGLVVALHRDFGKATPISASLLEQIGAWAQRLPVPAVSLLATAARTIVPAAVADEPVAVATAWGAGEALGRSIGSAVATQLEASERITLIVADGVETPGLTFRAECLVAGIGQELPRRVTCPQLFATPAAPPPAAAPMDRGENLVLRVRVDDAEVPGRLLACSTLVGADGLIRTARTWDQGGPGDGPSSPSDNAP